MKRTARVAVLQLRAFSVDQAEASLTHTLKLIDETVASDRPDIIALPEVTYPGYFLGSRNDLPPGVISPTEACDQIAERARGHGVYIAAGLALDGPDGGYSNSAALFGRDGSIIGRYDKTFLWHFDQKWFAPGDSYPVFETDIGRIGMLICADGRMPEIARSLALNGAQIIFDLTAWVSGARRPAALSTTQIEHLMRCRAAENGVWIVCADKFGIEAESIVYAGQSCVINPHGEIVASLGSDEERSLVFDVPIDDAQPPIMRRPELYDVLGHPTESLPVLRTLTESFVLPDEERRIAVVQMTMPPTGEEFLALAAAHVERQALMDADAIVFPATPSRYRHAYDGASLLASVQQLSSTTRVIVAFVAWEPDGDGHRAMYFVGPNGVIAKHRQTHKPPTERFASMPTGGAVCPVAQTPIGRVGMMLAAEGYVPEVARSLMLRGAEFILWSGDDSGIPMDIVARTRAEENRVFVACAGAPTENGAALIVDPSGRLLAIALAGEELAVGSEVNRAFSHVKERAPGTDVVRNRQPATYGAITRTPSAVSR